jgi:cytochrome c-type biogenesis protein CcmH
MRRLGFLIAALVAAFIAAAPALAVEPDEMLKDPALEQRARDISEQLRCLVCQNESIDNSKADLAKDLRLLVRRRLVAGDTNREVIDYIVARYGEFVLLKPPFEAKTILLWGAPAFILICGAIAMFVHARRRSSGPTGTPLTREEEAALGTLLSNSKDEKA